MKFFLINLLLIGSLFSGTYDDTYSGLDKKDVKSSEKLDPFMNGKFLEIIRFDRLDFSDGEISGTSENYLNEMSKIILRYVEDKKDIQIKIIGHSSKDSGDVNEALEVSKNFALDIAKKLEEKDINQNIITVEFRGSKDMAFSLETSEGMDLSNRVMVTMYEVAPKDKDSDNDGVFDREDKCLNTPTGVKTNELGCPLDSDKDGIEDYKDKCKETYMGASIDSSGCELDSDSDGVLDHKDICSGTIKGFSVDTGGCPINTELQLNFERRSSKISEESYIEIMNFADFMNDNKEYKIQIVGHTDSVGKAGENMRLSFDRADSVKTALVQEGVDANRIEAVGRGELDPTKTNRKADGRASNRRIEVKLFK